jgi:hypothetical protein
VPETRFGDHRVYTLSASGRKDYTWHRLNSDGTTSRVPYDPVTASAGPPGWTFVERWVRPGRPSLLVFSTPDGPGVLVSAIPSTRRRMGASVQEFILLVHTRPWYSPWQQGLVRGLLCSSPEWGVPLTGFEALAASVRDPDPDDPEAKVRIDAEALAVALDALAGEAWDPVPESTDPLPQGAWRDLPETRQQLLRTLLAADGALRRAAPVAGVARTGPGGGGILAAVVTDLAAGLLTPATWALTSHAKAPYLPALEPVTVPVRPRRTGCVAAFVLYCADGLGRIVIAMRAHTDLRR